MTASGDPHFPPVRELWPVMIIAAAVTTLGAGVAVRSYGLGPVDDAFISLRYASNWASGLGLSFNPGETVEGYTNFLLVLLEAVAIRLGMNPVTAMNLIGSSSLGLLAAVAAGFAYTLCTSRAWLAVVTGILVGLHPAVLCWGTSGMESGLVALFLVAALWSALTLRPTLSVWTTGILMVLASMTRPESVVIFPAMVLAVAGRTHSRKQVALVSGIFLVGFGSYFLLRAAFFGSLLPNTFYAKLDYGSLALGRRGLLYVWNFFLANPLLFGLAIASLFLHDRRLHWVRVALLLVLLHLLVVIYEGGDHFAMFRFMVPVIPFLVLVSVATLSVLGRSLQTARWRPVLMLIAALGLGGAGFAGAMQNKRQEPVAISQFQRYAGECRLARNWELMGHWFRVHSSADATICTVAIGAIGFTSGRSIIDPHGLIDPDIAGLDWNLGQGYTGHEKYDVSRVLAQQPDYILAVHYPTSHPVPRDALQGAVWGSFTKELLRSPVVQQDYDYQNVQLQNWYMNLLVRSR